jgi:signal recognition particle subunit SRP54
MLSKIRDVFSKITRASVVDESLVKEITREIQRILIQSDVNVALVQKISKDIEERVLKEKPPAGVTKKEHFTKTLYEELVKILGGEQYKPRIDSHRILLIGLFGSGKTTTVGKLAKFYSKKGLKAAAICTDVWRPAAFEQMKQVCDQIKVPAFGDPKEKDPHKILKDSLSLTKDYDIVIVDSAGRDSLNQELLDEIKKINDELKPQEKFLVISSDIGQTAAKQAESFNKLIGLTGVIATKADASGKAGGALSACKVAGVPIAFIGIGEKIDDFEVFDAKKFVSRLLGFPDLESLLGKVKEAVEEAEFNPEEILTGDYNLKTFYKQMEATRKMGPLKKVFEMMGMGSIPQEMVDTSEEKMNSFKHIIDSMTPAEREDPDVINFSRIKRIAKGSGTTDKDVKDLIKQFNVGKKMIKKLKKGKMRNLQGMLKRFQGGF